MSGRLHPEDREWIAQRVAELIAERLAGNLAATPRLVGVKELARLLGTST